MTFGKQQPLERLPDNESESTNSRPVSISAVTLSTLPWP
jgi:hypothetical protein